MKNCSFNKQSSSNLLHALLHDMKLNAVVMVIIMIAGLLHQEQQHSIEQQLTKSSSSLNPLFCDAFVPFNNFRVVRRTTTTSIYKNDNDDSRTNNNSDKNDGANNGREGDTNTNAMLLEQARILRADALVMEQNLRVVSSNKITPTEPAINSQLEGSRWTVTYRFSSQPISDDETDIQTKFYSGKLHLFLKNDGYSEQIIKSGVTESEDNNDNDNNSNRNNDNDIQIMKIWGWDRETSNEDNMDYLLFSMDVKIPKSDPSANSKNDPRIERYYFQARIEEEGENKNNSSSNKIELKDGTITVKKDITEKTKGRWGLFNVAGILTQFRYCGDFIAKPSPLM